MEHSAIVQKRRGCSTNWAALMILQADYNNDGCMDILIVRGGMGIHPANVAPAQ